MESGKLIICPTPIGNLGDMTQRALDALRGADVVCAEDTRVTGRLLAAFDIHKRLERLDEATMGARAAQIVDRVAAGEVVAYCTDAGMPGVSDPGLRLVAAAREAGVPVEVLPGPSAAATAYVASGCSNPRYYFGGFFPRKDAERRELLESLRPLDAALVFYESPKRLVGALGALAEAYPSRQASVCRELTKLHEEVRRDALPALRDEFAVREAGGAGATGAGGDAASGEAPGEVPGAAPGEAPAGIKGEIVIVVDGPSAEEGAQAAADAQEAARARAAELKAGGARNKEVARALVEEFGISRNEAYDLALQA